MCHHHDVEIMCKAFLCANSSVIMVCMGQMYVPLNLYIIHRLNNNTNLYIIHWLNNNTNFLSVKL